MGVDEEDEWKRGSTSSDLCRFTGGASKSDESSAVLLSEEGPEDEGNADNEDEEGVGVGDGRGIEGGGSGDGDTD